MEHRGASSGQMALLDRVPEPLPVEHPHPPFKEGIQLDRVHDVMTDGEWHTLWGIREQARRISETSVSARLRDLRKVKGHEHSIERKPHETKQGVYLYRMEEKHGNEER